MIERFTLKSQDAIERAVKLARKHKNGAVTPIHMGLGMLNQEDTPLPRYLHAADADASKLQIALRRRLSGFPTDGTEGHEQPDDALKAVFGAALGLADSMDDKYADLSHMLLALLDNGSFQDACSEAGADLPKLKKVLQEVRAGMFGSGDSVLDQYESLGRYCEDLTARATAGKLDPVIGRDAEIRQMIQVLSRRRKNNPLIIGEPGVGKTALVEGLALKLVHGDVPDNLKNHVVLALDLGLVVAGAKFRGEFEERLTQILQEIAAAGNILLFIDEVHMLIGAGGQEGSMDASNLLKPALARGELRCIGATTTTEFRKRIERDAALTRRFQNVVCEEPSVNQTMSILRGLKEKYEVHHGVRITDAAIAAAARLSDRYIADRYLPDKAIDLIDEAAAAIRMDISSKPEEIAKIDRRVVQHEIDMKALEHETDPDAIARRAEIARELDEVKAESAELTAIWQNEKKALFEVQQAKTDLEAARLEMEQKIRDEDYSRVAELQYKIIPDREKTLEEFGDLDVDNIRFLREEVLEEDVAKTVSRWTGIPATRMLASERERLMQMEDHMRNRVIGQENALTSVCRAVRRTRAGVQPPGRPISFLMLGPTGVGKTELCKALAEFLFNDERALIRFDMSEFMEKQSVAKLIGAAPGYVGYEEGGLLTNKVRTKPYSVVLFDEVEKAHPDIFKIQLQMLDDGRLTDSQGRLVDFGNTVVILTSNLGAHAIEDFKTEAEDQKMRDTVMEAVKAHFRPEFLNRLDEIVIFKRLTEETMRPIVDIQLLRLDKLLDERKIKLELQPSARALIAREGFDPAYGARPLKRALQTLLQNPLSEEILAGRVDNGSRVLVSAENGALKLRSLSEGEEVPEDVPLPEPTPVPVPEPAPAPEPASDISSALDLALGGVTVSAPEAPALDGGEAASAETPAAEEGAEAPADDEQS